jgi:polysaccharide biosynthesis/export protein
MIIYQKKLLLLFVIFAIFSCASKKDLLYFGDVNFKEKETIKFIEGKIQTNDILSIQITSNKPELAALYNTPNSSTLATSGYLVSQEGFITLPVLGKFKVKDLAFSALENVLTKTLIDNKHLLDPVVSVRLMNAKFTVLGEVKSPGTYTFNEQNISILQALGYAGDLTINGKRKDVLLIREENNVRTYTTIDLTSKKWFEKSYYIRPNDVIYVNPNGPKISSSGYIQNIAAVLGVISLAITSVLLLTN